MKIKRYITLFLNRHFAKAPEAIVVCDKGRTNFGLIITARVAILAAENKETINYGLFCIHRECKLPPFVVSAILEYGELTCDAKTFATVIRTTAEYYNTSVDFLLGLTDRT